MSTPHITGWLAGTLATLLLAGCATQHSTAPNAGDMPPAINAGGIMVSTVTRMTLYTSERDTANTSHCNDTCTQQWPPLYAQAGDVSRGDFSVFTRADGRQQWALTGKPLYFSAQDTRPGDTAGDAAEGVWHIFRVPAPQPPATPPAR